MKEFQKRELREAINYAATGNQALHLHNVIANWKQAPLCFRAAIRRGDSIGHLFDQDYDRLIKTARMLGIKRIQVERRGQPGQHIDLCGSPLDRAFELCDEDSFE